jgi:hypothetical protein
MDKDSEMKKMRQSEYGVYVRRDGDLFTLMIPELGIARRHQDLNEGFRELTLAQGKYFKDLADSGCQSFPPKPNMPVGAGALVPSPESFTSPYSSFFLKAAIIMLLLCGVGGFGTVILGNAVVKNFSRVTTIVGDKMAALSDDEVQKYAQKVHQISKKIKPVVYEMKLLWDADGRSKAELQQQPENLEASH